MKIALIGSGAFSLAITTLLLNNNENELTMWSHDVNFKLKKSLQEKINVNYDLCETIRNNDIIFILIASSFMKDTMTSLPKKIFQNKKVLIGTKGLLSEKPYFYSNYFFKKFSIKDVGYFAGPNLAKDIVNHNPISMTFAIQRKKDCKVICEMFHDVKITFCSSLELLELASVLKNIYAIGSGIIDSYYSSQSTLFSYLSYALDECFSILDRFKPLEKGFLSADYMPVDVVGDFFLTGTMPDSRNRTYGTLLITPKRANEFQKNHTVEGLEALESCYQLLQKKKVKAPIFFTIYQIVKQNESPKLLEEVVFMN